MEAVGGPSQPKRRRTDSHSQVEVPEMINSSDLSCPICLELYQAVQVTTCGHSFCAACLERSLLRRPECPVCKANLGGETMTCNFALNDIVSKVRNLEKDIRRHSPAIVQVRRMMSQLPAPELRMAQEEA